MYRIPNDQEEITLTDISDYIAEHNSDVIRSYKPLLDAYMTKYPILSKPAKKEKWKPDKRIAVNYAKYIVDTFNGFFAGIPVKVMCDEDERISDYVNLVNSYNNADDEISELAKLCDIYGHAYEMYYVDKNGDIAFVQCSPIDAFMIYDDSVVPEPRYFVRTYMDAEGTLRGSISDSRRVRWFYQAGGLQWDGEEKLHGFDGVPAVEFLENEDRQSIFAPVMTMINEYNDAISEKANDVDYFADAYLKILGAVLDNNTLSAIRDSRIINFEGNDISNLVVEFLEKPNGDETQEHLLDRLERQIYQISMVANISDENFGTSSGIAMRYKLQAMSNMAASKQRKFQAGLNKRYKLIFSNPVSGMRADDWVKLTYQFSLNLPANLLEETQIAQGLTGIVSQKTQLSVLSIVDNVQAEIDQIQQEEEDSTSMGFPTERTSEVVVEDELLE